MLGELTEWWEDLWQRGIGSQVVLVAVPPGWGRSVVLGEFRAVAGSDEGPVVLVVPVDGNLPPGQAVQADLLKERLRSAADGSRAAELMGLDTAAGRVLLGLGLTAFLVSGPVGTASLLAASLAVTAGGNAWDRSPAGEQGAVGRAARAVAAVSVKIPVAVIIDDADRLDPALAVTLIRNLAGRHDGQVLVVAAAAPGSDLMRTLVRDAGYELAGRVHRAEADPGMGYRARAGLAGELLPDLPAAGAERIARRTRTFAEVFAVAAAAGRLAELGPEAGADVVVDVVDAVADAALDRDRPSPEAIALAWADGALHANQAGRVLEVLGAGRLQKDPRVVRTGSLVRLAGTADARLAEQVAILPAGTRHDLAAAVLGAAVRLAADPDAGVVERVVARQAAHRVRADLTDRTGLTGVQCALIRGLEKLGDLDAAHQVAAEALAELPPAGEGAGGGRQELLMAVLRLARTRPGHDDDPLAGEAVALALAGGATVSLEARVWAAVDLLSRPGRREAGVRLASQVAAELESRRIPGAVAAQWRLLLAFHAGQAGQLALAQRLLSTMINSGPAAQQDIARAVLRKSAGPRADTRLQAILLEAELSQTPAGADDDRLRLHATLAEDYNVLGEYQQALHHASQELPLRRRIQGDDHPGTLTTRGNIAGWVGECGDAARALALFEGLLPDQVRVLGGADPRTLATRSNIASWVGECGDAARALALFEGLLPDQVRVLGAAHPDTLTTRDNIALWAGRCGDAARALRLCEGLLPDMVRVLGPAHPDTLTTRNNLAGWAGECGDAARALALFEELLPDQVRVLGTAHPGTLTTRGNLAGWAAQCGDAARALRLYEELLPEMVRVLGPAYPDTLTTRSNIAFWTEALHASKPGSIDLSQTDDP
jgi:Tetratricopeptide repeat